MKILGAFLFSTMLATSPAWAEGSKEYKSQQTQQQSPSEQQQAQQQQGQHSEQAKIEGKVQQVGQEELTLSVAGTEVSLEADQQQLQGIEEGDSVQVTAVPLPEAESMKSAQQASPEERQKAQEQGSKSLSGTVEQIQQDIVTLKTQQGSQKIKVDQRQAQSLQQGQEYIFELSSAPDEAKTWRAEQVEKQM